MTQKQGYEIVEAALQILKSEPHYLMPLILLLSNANQEFTPEVCNLILVNLICNAHDLM